MATDHKPFSECPQCGGVAHIYSAQVVDGHYKRYYKCKACRYTFRTIEIEAVDFANAVSSIVKGAFDAI